MVVLNFYGKIDPICISKKLGLYISNLPNVEHNEWKDELVDELELAVKADRIYQEKLGTNYPCGIVISRPFSEHPYSIDFFQRALREHCRPDDLYLSGILI